MSTDFPERFLKWVSLAGTLAFVVGVLLTMTDIGLRSFSTLTVKGVVDLMQLCVLTGAMLAIPHGFLTDQHVAIDVFAERMPERVQVALRVIASLLGALFLAGVVWFGYKQSLNEMGDRSQTIGILMGWYWFPFLAGMGLSVLANILMCIRLLRHGLPRAQGPKLTE
jgi:TRAP-type C4-dicarboxylate transport system permease small subunit